MKGMIMHHSQAVEMTAMIESHTENTEIRLLGARISKSQSDEVRFMVRWLDARGEISPPSLPALVDMRTHDGRAPEHRMLMPGMLSRDQIDALKNATGPEFDRLFLTGMIQHHNGALIMVKDLFEAPCTGQDAELFNFVTDVDSGQRAEIKIMQNLLGEKPVEEKP